MGFRRGQKVMTIASEPMWRMALGSFFRAAGRAAEIPAPGEIYEVTDVTEGEGFVFLALAGLSDVYLAQWFAPAPAWSGVPLLPRAEDWA